MAKKNKQIKEEPIVEETVEEVKEEPIVESPQENVTVKGYKLAKDFTKAMKAGYVISEDQYQGFKARGIDIDSLLE